MSLIECLVDPNCHGMHDDNYHFPYEVEAAMGRYDHKLDTWKIIASSGDYSVDGESVGHAYLRFVESHPDDFVQAIISSEMEIEGYKAEVKREGYPVKVHHAAVRGHCAECDAAYAEAYADEHSALCRSRISGETEDRCNCK
jgi:hypothetical protein